MTGHKQIIALRRKGIKPSIVFVTDIGPDPIRWRWQQGPEATLEAGDQATVYLPGNPNTADLRWAKDLILSLCLTDNSIEKFDQFVIAFLQAEPKAIIAVEPNGELFTWPQ
jgi:hypothetical protein